MLMLRLLSVESRGRYRKVVERGCEEFFCVKGQSNCPFSNKT